MVRVDSPASTLSNTDRVYPAGLLTSTATMQVCLLIASTAERFAVLHTMRLNYSGLDRTVC